MAKASNDVSRIICANTIQENEKRLLETRIKSQGRNRVQQDLNKLFNKLNQNAVGINMMKHAEPSNSSCCKGNIINYLYGPVPDFPPGSWWGIRMDCSRDHIHNPFDADIHNGPFGVISVCTSHNNTNEDIDLGDLLTLTGQIYCEEQPNADPFIWNYKSQIPLRLIRSYNLQNHIAPNTGYRYDGLYTVIRCWIGTSSNGIKYNKFALMRLADQGPPTWDRRLEEKHSPFMQHHISSTKFNYSKLHNLNAYNLRKYSYNTDSICGKRKFNLRDKHEDLSTPKITQLIENRKSVPESSIVTRHVFKKPSNIETTTLGIASIPDQKVLSCLGTSAPKAHSTNISIRMGLYESSHNVQEAKKNVSNVLHKPFKPIDIANRTALDIDVHLRPKENNKLNGTVNIGKTQSNIWAMENTFCNGRVAATDNVEKLVHPLNKRRRNLFYNVASSSGHSYVMSSSINNNDNDINSSKFKVKLQDIQQCVNVSAKGLNSDSELQSSSLSMHERVSKQHNISETASESLFAQNIKFLDSLTPDKILNLINKEKHRPLSKLLIGNVIGLTFEECAMLHTSKITLDSNSKIHTSKIKKGRNVKRNIGYLSEDILNGNYCKYAKSKKLSWKRMKQLDIGKFDKMLPNIDCQPCEDTNANCNINVRIKDQSGLSKENAEYLPSFRLQASLQTITHHAHSTYDLKTRLRAHDKAELLTKQEFSNSTIKKNKYKKQDREIANLLIDANISPKSRGPRNRRLRCINNTYTNKRYYSTINTVMHQSSKCNRITKKQQYKSSFKRKNKLVKANLQLARDRQIKDRYAISNTLHTKRNNNNKNINNSNRKDNTFENATNNNKNNDDVNSYNNNTDGNRKSKNRTIINDTNDHNISKTCFDKSLRKRLVQTIPLQLSRRASQTTRLRYFREKVVKPITTDATTQCRLIPEGLVENIHHKHLEDGESENLESELLAKLHDQTVFIKMEWDKLKSESVHDITSNMRGSQTYQASSVRSISAFTENDACRRDNQCYGDSSGPSCRQSINDSVVREKYERSFKTRASAFVPVNAFDNDLRIARLRSIGFKPIIKPRSPFVMDEQTIQSFQSKDTNVSTSKIIKRNVAEEYDKYTNEDNNIVVYMDDELQFQDIEEEEDENALLKEYMRSYTNVSMRSLRGQSKDDIVLSETLPLHENVESPWHGWKKIIMNNESYWIGW